MRSNSNGDPGSLLSAEDTGRDLVGCNDARADYPLRDCICDLFERRAGKCPEEIAIIFENESLTFHQLQERVGHLAAFLGRIGVEPDCRVAICVKRSFEMVIGILGILKAGGAYVPLDPDWPQERIAEVIADSGATLVLTTSGLAGRVSASLAARMLLLDRDYAEQNGSTEPGRVAAPAVLPENLAYVIYTSGSTGKPKGVMIEHRSILNTLRFMQAMYPVYPGQSYLLKTNYAFDVSISELFGWFIGDGHLVILPPGEEMSPTRLAARIQQHGISHLNFAPSALRVFLNAILQDQQWLKRCPVRYLMVAGEAFPKDLVEMTVGALKNARVENIYGPTEVSIYASYFSCSNSKIASANTPIGRPLANTELYILDEQLRPVSAGTPGELCVAGHGLARGYLNQPDLTAEKFVPNPFAGQGEWNKTRLYRTGDLARWLEDGSVEYLGRIDHQVKIRGFRIELGEIEINLNRHPGVRESSVVAQDFHGSKRLIAYYTPKEKAGAEELRDFLAGKLPDYMIPAFFVGLDSLPLLSSGKVDRANLINREVPVPERVHGTAVASTLEARVLQVWKEVLRLPEISLTANFFELGGDSLLAATLVERMNQSFAAGLTTTELFEYTCVQKMCARLEEGRLAGASARAQQVPEDAVDDSFVAIVGMSGRFPRANNLEEFWINIAQGRDCVTEVPCDRWDWKQTLGDQTKEAGKTGVSWGGFVPGVREFDPLFFDISPREGELMDPQQRLLLTHSWLALEDAAIPPSLFSKRSTGVFMAAGLDHYASLGANRPEDNPYAVTASMASMISSRISYALNLRGPSEVYETACSSALTALHRAIHSIQRGECEQAIVGAVNLLLSPKAFGFYEAMGLLSLERVTRPFQEGANGYVRSEGVGVLIIKPLRRALEDRDQIYAVVRGTGVCHGGKGMSLTAPNTAGMRAAMVQAYRSASVDPRTVTYIEAHGIASPIGDGIEIDALKSGYRELANAGPPNRPAEPACHISSLKPCVGHGEIVSGMGALIKVVYAMRNRIIPGIPRFTKLNDQVSVTQSPFRLTKENQPWESLEDSRGQRLPRRASINSYGLGVNAHAVLEEWPVAEAKDAFQNSAGLVRIVPISAKGTDRLQALLLRIKLFLETAPDISFADFAYTMQVGRENLKDRLAILASSIQNVSQALSGFSIPPVRSSDTVFFGTASADPRANEECVKNALQTRDLKELARLWSEGSEIPWATLWTGNEPKRISVPGSPFLTRECWVDHSSKTVGPPLSVPSKGKRICVVGAGPAGLVMAKSLLEEGHRPVIYEAQDVLGGIWNGQTTKSAGAYKRTRFQNSKDTSFFSDFYPKTSSSFLALEEVNDYLHQYARAFGLDTLIEYQSNVVSVREGENRKWTVKIWSGGAQRIEEFDGVALCQGRYRTPKIPAIEGMDQFQGQILHSAQYYDQEIFRGKRVLIVGNGVSGMDIAEEAAESAARVLWSVRSLRLVLPRMVGFLPNDFVSPANLLMPDEIRSRRNLERLKQSMPDYYDAYQKSGLFPSLEEFRRFPFILINDGAIKLVAEGRIETIRGGIQRFLSDGCTFANGETVKGLDLVVLCTGYDYSSCFDYLEDIIPARDFAMGLFYHKNPTLVNPYGLHEIGTVGSFPYLEMSARWYAQILSEKYQLDQRDLSYREHPHNIVVAPIATVLIGLKLGLFPKPETEFREFWKLMTCPAFPMAFRLRGEHQHSEAAPLLSKCLQRALIQSDQHDPELELLKYRLLAGLGSKVLEALLARSEISASEYQQALLHQRDPLILDWDSQFMRMDWAGGETSSSDRSDREKDGQVTAVLSSAEFQYRIREIMARTLKLDAGQIRPENNLSEYGFNSVTLTAFAQEIADSFEGLRLSPAVFMEHFTLQDLSNYIHQKCYSVRPALVQKDPSAPKQEGTRVAAKAEEEIAIIGMGGRFPRASSLTEFWTNLVQDINCVSKIPSHRWDWKEYFGDPADENRTDCSHGAFIAGVADFDSLHFNISPKEASLMDPQQRLLLEAVWETLENGGYAKDQLFGGRVGLFLGVERVDYADVIRDAGYPIDGYLNTGNSPAMLVNRIAHFYGWKGPVLAVNAACASSFVALHAAVNSLRRSEAEVAVAGGVHLLLRPETVIANRKLKLFTGQDHTSPFDRDASGHFFGDAVGLVFLKPLARALRDGDQIHGVIKGIAVRHGGQGLSLIAPNVSSHRAIIEEALREAELSSDEIDYIEAQGTANPMADLAELKAYHAVFSNSQGKRIPIGSIKGHTGHFAGASGVVSLIKAILSLKNERLIKVANFKNLNWTEEETEFCGKVLDQTVPWTQKMRDGARVPRRIGVHNFGFGGVTGHLILEEFVTEPPVLDPRPSEGPELIVLSARTKDQIAQLAEKILRFSEAEEFRTYGATDIALRDIAYTLQIGRQHLEERCAFVAESVKDLKRVLEEIVQGHSGGILRGNVESGKSFGRFFSDSEIKPLIDRWTQARDLLRIADVWIHGGKLHWELLYTAGRKPKRICLPTYPFLKENYWVPVQASAEQVRISATRVTHPAPVLNQGLSSGLLREFIGDRLGISSERMPLNQRLSDLGFNSLDALALRYRLEQACSSAVPLRLLNPFQTLEEMAENLPKLFPAGRELVPLATATFTPQPSETEERFPLTDIQESYLVARKVLPEEAREGSVVYLEIEVTDLDLSRLNAAWNRLISRHAMLRTVTLPGGGQVVLKEVPEYRFDPVEMGEAQTLERIRTRLSSQVYDAEKWPLFELQTSVWSGKTLLHISIDTLVVDGAAVDILLHDWHELYSEPLKELPSLDFSFRDYVVAVREAEQSLIHERALEERIQRLGGIPGGPSLPLGTAHQSSRRTRLKKILEHKNLECLKERAAGLNVSLSALLLAAFTETLRFGAEEGTFSIVVTLFNRMPLHRDLDKVVGPVSSTGIFVAENHTDRPFDQTIQHTQESLWEVLEGSSVTGIKLLRELKRRRKANQTLALPVVFTSLVGAKPADQVSPFAERISYSVIQTPHVYLEHQARERNGNLEIVWYVSKDHFAPGVVEDLFDCYWKTLDSLAQTSEPWNFPVSSFGIEPFPLLTRPEGESSQFPLTDLQRAYAFGRAQADAKSGSQICLRFEVENLDVARLEKAWNTLIHTHGMLATTVRRDGTQQKLESVPDYQIAVADLRSNDILGIESVLRATEDSMLAKTYPLGSWPYFELRVSVVDEVRSKVHFCMDLMLADAASIHLLAKQLFEVYANPEAGSSRPSISFSDYGLAAEAFTNTENGRAHLQYWERKFAGIPSGPGLRLAIRRRHTETERVEAVLRHWSQIEELAEQFSIAPATVLLTAFGEVLGAWSDAQRFTLPIPSWGRFPWCSNLGGVIGDFTILSWIIFEKSSASFAEKLRRQDEQWREDLSHRNVSGLRSLRKLSMQPGGREIPSFPVVFSDLVPESSFRFPEGVRFEGSLSRTSQVLLDNISMERDGALTVQWDFVKSAYPDGMIQEMFAGYVRLLETLSTTPEAWARTDFVEIIQARPDRYQCLTCSSAAVPGDNFAGTVERWNNTGAPYRRDKCIHELFEEKAAQFPDSIATIHHGQRRTYGELNRTANRLASRLIRQGVAPQDFVGICISRSFEMIAGLLGILKSGGAYVPLEPGYPAERLATIAQIAGIQTILTEQKHTHLFQRLNLKLILIDAQADGNEENLALTLSSLNTAYVIFTSGSTGVPKGVVVQHRPVINLIEWAEKTFGFNASDVGLFVARLSFDLSVFDVFGLLAYGAAIHIVDDDVVGDSERLAELLAHEEISFWNSAPGTLQLMVPFLKKRQITNRKLRLAFLSGDWIPVRLPDEVRSLFAGLKFISLGGATEATVWSNHYSVDRVDPDWRSIPYGKPIQNARYYILDQDLRLCPVGVAGDLYIGGECLSKGYLNAPEITAKSFVPDPFTKDSEGIMYRTGDLARFFPDGNIEFLGRSDSQVKVRGFRIELEEIEHSLRSHSEVEDALVLVKELQPGDQKIVAYLITAGGKSLPAGMIRDFLRPRLPEYMLPNLVICLREFPVTPNGKIDRKALPWPPRTGNAISETGTNPSRNGSAAAALPKTRNVAAELIQSLSDVLDTEGLEVTDDLFDHGATSFTMLQIVEKVQTLYGFPVPGEVFLASPTIQAIAGYIATKLDADGPADNLPANLQKERDAAATEEIKKISLEAVELSERTGLGRSGTAGIGSLDLLGRLLSLLKRAEVDGKPKYLYSSAGGLNPIQTYLLIKPGGVEGLAPGVYYYHPNLHRLYLVEPVAEFSSATFHAQDRPVYEQAAFALFFIARMDAIAPLYKEAALALSILEAGYITQLLLGRQSGFDLGLASVVATDFDRVRRLFRLDPNDRFIHCVVGGFSDAACQAERNLSRSLWNRIPASQPSLGLLASLCRTDGDFPSREESERLHEAQAQLRIFSPHHLSVPLSVLGIPEAYYRCRAAKREYLEEPVLFQNFCRCLALFRHGDFSLELYVYVAKNGVQGIDEGIYRFSADKHQLTLVSSRLSRDLKSCHRPFNRRHADRSKFSLFLIAPGPDRDDSQDETRLLLQAGFFGQLLLERQAELGIGACPIGGLMFDALRPDFRLQNGQELAHSFVCGSYRMERPRDWSLLEVNKQQEHWLNREAQDPISKNGRSKEIKSDLAIVGLSGRYPGSSDLSEFGENLKQGRTCFTDVSYSNAAEYRRQTASQTPSQTHHAGFLQDVDCFDARLFKISPVEARTMDPQERLLLEVVWECLEESGYTAWELNASSPKVGVFIGVMWNDYEQHGSENWRHPRNPRSMPLHNSMANRISFFFNFTGPSLVLNTSCSSALTAIHYACNSIRTGECTAALVGGVNLMTHPYHQEHLHTLDLLSKKGECHPFGLKADGWIAGEGIGVILIRPRDDAERQGDHIHGIIKGTAIGHSGKTIRYSAPSPDRQLRTMQETLRQAGTPVDSINYVEAAAAGASMADTSEMTALKELFAAVTTPVFVGTVKANIGHLESASAMSQLAKVLLQFKEGQIFPSIGFKPINPMIQLQGSQLTIADELQTWPVPQPGTDRLARRALINAFGAAGSSAHLVIEEYIAASAEPETESAALIPLSAATDGQLRQIAQRLLQSLPRLILAKTCLTDVAQTLRTGRVEMSERLAIVASSTSDLREKLDAYVSQNSAADQGVFWGTAVEQPSTEELSDVSDLFEVARRWVSGAGVLPKSSNQFRHRRVSLPTYPFAQERFWIQPASPHSEPVTGGTRHLTAPEDGTLRAEVELYLKRLFSSISEIPVSELGSHATFDEFGLTSFMIHEWNAKVAEDFGDLSKTLLFEYRTIHELADYFILNHAAKLQEILSLPPSSMISQPSLAATVSVSAPALGNDPTEDIAIIGVSGRYPKAKNLDEFWENLKNGNDCISEVPLERWDYRKYLDPRKSAPGKIYSRWGGFIDDVDCFDPLFFNISPQESGEMDPQERLFLQTVWHTFEDAGYTRASLKRAFDTKVGVYVGVTYGDYQLFSRPPEHDDPGLVVRSCYGSIANRVSYFFDFTGPSMAVDTLCSSSLTALHLAVQAVRAGECAAAIVGGVNLSIHPNKYILQAQIRMTSTDGRCRSFGEGGDGFIPGEGVGAVLIKPRATAERDEDQIYAIIKGTSINNDGRTHGYTVPNPNAQAELVKRALKRAAIDPRSVTYVEAHGTGTELGDPVEIAGLTKAFASSPIKKQCCAIGSVKSNIGHLEAAAGIAGLTKILLQMKHGLLVPSLHAQSLNPKINFAESPFYVQRTLSEWKRPLVDDPGGMKEGPRVASISSFGAGGANAHAVLIEYLDRREPSTRRSEASQPFCIVLSARDKDRLHEVAAQLLDRVQKARNLEIGDIAFTLQIGREELEQRLGLLVDSMDDLESQLELFLAGSKTSSRIFTGRAPRSTRGEDGADLVSRELVAQWIGDGELAKVLESWVKGLQVDWHLLYPKTASPKIGPRRMSLPGYPFARERYWVGASAAEPAPSQRHGGEWTLQPLPDRFDWISKIQENNAKRIAIISSDPEDMEAFCTLLEQLRSSAGLTDPVRPQTGLIQSLLPGTIQNVPDIVFVLDSSNRSSSAISQVEACLNETAGDLTIYFYYLGSETIRERSGAEETIGRHPKWVWTLVHHDAVDNSANGLQLLAREWLFAQNRPGSSSIFEIRYEKGARLLRERAAPSDAGSSPSGDCWMEKVWKEATVHPQAQPFSIPGATLILVNADSVKLAEQLSSRFLTGSAILSGESDVQFSPSVRCIDFTDAASVQSQALEVMDEFKNCSLLLDLSDLYVTSRDRDRDPLGKIAFYQALLRATSINTILYFTKGLQAFGAAEMSLAGAKFAGLIKMLSAEHHNLNARHIDIDHAFYEDPRQWEAAIHQEKEAPLQETEICYRLGKRYVPFVQVRNFQPLEHHGAQLPLKGKGVYVIAGGTSGIGLEIAKTLASRGVKNLVLIGVTPVPPKAQWPQIIGRADCPPDLKSKLAALKVLDETVSLKIYTKGLGDLKGLEIYFDEVRKDLGPIRGVIHSAVRYPDQKAGAFLDKTIQSMELVLQPKVQGLEYLHQVFLQDQLDFFVSFSSVSALLPRLARGISDYALANAFAGFFTDYQFHQKQNHSIRLILWTCWSESGAQARAVKMGMLSPGQTLRQLGLNSVSNSEGSSLFHQSLSLTSKSQIVLGRFDRAALDVAQERMFWAQPEPVDVHVPPGQAKLDQLNKGLDRLEQMRADGEIVTFSHLSKVLAVEDVDHLPAVIIDRIDRLLPGGGEVAMADQTDPNFRQSNGFEQRTLSADLSGIVQQALRDVLRLQDVDNHESFQNYGLDSISGIRLSNRLEQLLQQQVQPGWLIDFPTVHSLAEHLGTEVLPIQPEWPE